MSSDDNCNLPSRSKLFHDIADGKIRNTLTKPQQRKLLWSEAQKITIDHKNGSRKGNKVIATRNSHRADFNNGTGSCYQSYLLRPQRINMPTYLNLPERTSQTVTSQEQLGKLKNRISDFSMIRESSRRVKNHRNEGRSVFSIAIIYDNMNRIEEAIQYYKDFLKICSVVNDFQGYLLACHCLSIDYFLLSEKLYTDLKDEKINGHCDGWVQTEKKKKLNVQDILHLLDEAMLLQNRYKDGSDQIGKLLANVNLSIMYRSVLKILNENEEKQATSERFITPDMIISALEEAYVISADLGSEEGKLLALGCLIANKDIFSENKERTKKMIQKYIDLSQELHYKEGVKIGMEIMGDELEKKQSHEEAFKLYSEILPVSTMDEHELLKIKIGISKGEMELANHFQQLLSNSVNSIL